MGKINFLATPTPFIFTVSNSADPWNFYEGVSISSVKRLKNQTLKVTHTYVNYTVEHTRVHGTFCYVDMDHGKLRQ